MSKLNGYLFLLIALTMLLSAVGVTLGSEAVHEWIRIISFVVIGIMGIKSAN